MKQKIKKHVAPPPAAYRVVLDITEEIAGKEVEAVVEDSNSPGFAKELVKVLDQTLLVATDKVVEIQLVQAVQPHKVVRVHIAKLTLDVRVNSEYRGDTVITESMQYRESPERIQRVQRQRQNRLLLLHLHLHLSFSSSLSGLRCLILPFRVWIALSPSHPLCLSRSIFLILLFCVSIALSFSSPVFELPAYLLFFCF